MKPVALVTGASRGIGRATAVALAEAGFDLVLSARTVEEGEAREHSPTVNRSDTRPIPGSLRTSAAAVVAAGGAALVLPADLLDRDALARLAADALAWRGRVDVLVNNGRFIGPGHADDPITVPFEFVEKTMEANFYAPLLLCRMLVPQMVERGGGRVVNVTSAAAFFDPHAAGLEPGVRSGATSLPYGASKAALLRIAPILNFELARFGFRCFDVDPGGARNERVEMEMPAFAAVAAPPDVIGRAIAWLATNDAADALLGRVVDAQRLCAGEQLVPGWTKDDIFKVKDARSASLGRRERDIRP